MTLKSTPPTSFDPFHPDGLIFEESPHLFVNLDANPIVFTVRGIALFAERFRRVGVHISAVTTRPDFDAAFSAWLRVERELLDAKLTSQARTAAPISDEAILAAIWRGDLAGAEAIASKKDRLASIGLRIV